MTTTAVTKVNLKAPVTINAAFLETIRDKWLQQSNKETFAREISFVLQHVARNKSLAKCTGESVLAAVLNITQTGLTLNPALKLAYLVPRYTGGAMQCTLEASYQGLVKLVTDTGSVKEIYSHPVFKGDVLEVSLGTSVEVTHKPEFNSKELDKIYAVGVLKDGSKQVEVMTAEDINAIRDRSESYKAFKDPKKPQVKTAIWETHYIEMARKTVIRRLCKYLPKTEQWDRVANAINIDEEDYRASDTQLGYLESLIGTSTIAEERKDSLYTELNNMTADRASELIVELKEKQADSANLSGPDIDEQSKQRATND